MCMEGECENKMKQRKREAARWAGGEGGSTVNVKHLAHAALYLQAGKIQSFVCEHNRALAFQSSDVCTHSSYITKSLLETEA